ncbi:G-protein coupled receptor Mth2 [Anabrus simplex]|uniref:G-protein coupled receptor Mth2 n=1 Tax=Anabrus simplex TaxID=316456 RepID=UPI0035A34597
MYRAAVTMFVRVVLWGALLTSVTSFSPDLPSECASAPDKACVPKCCPAGHVLKSDKACHNTSYVLKFQLGKDTASDPPPESYVVVYGDPCKAGKYPLDPDDEDDYSYLLANGSLVIPTQFTNALGPKEFCLETLWEEEDSHITTPFICFPEVSKAERSSTLHFIIYPIGLLISVPFLIATVVIYLVIPGLGDLHGKALCCYCSCLAVAYFFLAVVQFGGSSFSDDTCIALACIIQYFFVACFFWLNVLCIDTFWCIMAITGWVSWYPGLQPWKWQENKGLWMVIESEDDRSWNNKLYVRRVFLTYSVYAWCVPLVLLASVVFTDLHPTIPSSYVKPHMGQSKCWFSSDAAALNYFYAPIATVLLTNLVLFIVTMYMATCFNWNPSGPHRTPKQKARMCLLLFLTMGVSWMFEIVSWAVGGPQYVWVVTDAFNILQGVVIFCIYVLEPRVKYLVHARLWERLTVILGKYSCCKPFFPTPESQLPSPLPEENNTMLTQLEESFEIHAKEMKR